MVFCCLLVSSVKLCLRGQSKQQCPGSIVFICMQAALSPTVLCPGLRSAYIGKHRVSACSRVNSEGGLCIIFPFTLSCLIAIHSPYNYEPVCILYVCNLQSFSNTTFLGSIKLSNARMYHRQKRFCSKRSVPCLQPQHTVTSMSC